MSEGGAALAAARHKAEVAKTLANYTAKTMTAGDAAEEANDGLEPATADAPAD